MNVLCWISSASNSGSLDTVDIPECLCFHEHEQPVALFADLHVLLRVDAAC